MNIKKYSIIALLMVLAMGFNACTEECDYLPAEPVNKNCSKASFSAAEDGFFLEVTPTEEKKMTLTLTRENTESEATIELLVKQNDNDIFQIPESVTFASGVGSTTFDVTFPDAEIGVKYSLTLALKNDDVDPYQEVTTATLDGSIQVVQWEPIGTGSLNSGFFEETIPCEIMKASHAAWYKAVDPVEEGKSIVFKVDENNSVLVEDQAIYTHPSYGLVYVNNIQNNPKGEGTYDPEKNIIQAALYYYCGAGYFGTFVETLTLPAK